MAERRSTNPLPKEKEIEKMILQWLDLHHNVFCWKQNTTGMYDEKRGVFRSLQGFCRVGISDILGIVRPSGKLFAIEVKTPAGAKTHVAKFGLQCTPEQDYFITRVRAYGGFGLRAPHGS